MNDELRTAGYIFAGIAAFMAFFGVGSFSLVQIDKHLDHERAKEITFKAMEEGYEEVIEIHNGKPVKRWVKKPKEQR
jgi:Pyruvate/2-oxoacid:ferredoxin oxidoreductase gamma subunit